MLRHFGMLSRLWPHWQDANIAAGLPTVVRVEAEAAALMAAEHDQRLRWEVDRIYTALAAVDSPVILLKGAAYSVSGLSCGLGRLASDVDILVPAAKLESVEAALLAAHWEAVIVDDYDQQYYRRWAHELPPLRHRLRGTTVDVHHTIVPLSSRLRPDAALLIAAAQAVPLARGYANGKADRNTARLGDGLAVLAPADMVLHSVVHSFFDGDFSHVLRDLLDVHQLLRELGCRSGFWTELTGRAAELGLQRPLFYALRYCQRYLATEVAASVRTELPAPSAPVTALMDRLVDQAVYAVQPTTAAHLALYVRSHWLRMPPRLLAQHLLHKGYRRLVASRTPQGTAIE